MARSFIKSHPDDTVGNVVFRLVRYVVLANAVGLPTVAGMDLLLGEEFGPGVYARIFAATTLGCVIGFGIQLLRQMPDGKNQSGMLEPTD